MTKLFFAASTAALMTVAGLVPAMAQSSTSGSAMSPMISCRDISTMDRETARSVVFYMSGFKAAGMQNQASSGTSGTSGSTSGSTTADAGSSGSTTSSGASSDTSGSAAGSTTADAGSSGSSGSSSDTTGSTTAAGGTASGSSDTSGSGTASGASGGASSTIVAQLPGFNSTDVDRVMADCASSPDRQLSEVIGGTASTP